MRRWLLSVLAIAGTLCVSPGETLAQTTIVKPEFLLVVDTSGSMVAAAPANSCGYTPANRINAAACAVRNLADGTGEAIFGMQTYTMNCSNTGTHYSYGAGIGCGTMNCNWAYPTSTPAARAWPALPFDFFGCDDGGAIQVPIAESNQYTLRSWGDGSFTSCTTPPAIGQVGGNELSTAGSTAGAAVSNTPLAGSIRLAYRYLRGEIAGRPSPYLNFNNTGQVDPYASCRPVNVIHLTDGEECCGTTYSNNCENSRSSMGAQLNARNLGCLQVDLNGNGTIDDPIPNSDSNPALRGKYESNIDLNRDGDCYDDGEQRAFRVRTYVIGFGVTCAAGNGLFTAVEDIARAGGVPSHTVSCTTGNRFGYYAQNEADISAAINDIVAQSALRERCNSRDDNCNSIVDEGFDVGTSCTVGVGACLRTGAKICLPDGTGTQCSASPGLPGTESSAASCRDGIDNDCDGTTDCLDSDCSSMSACSCTPGPEVCDGRDNNCDGRVDEGGITRPCGVAIGECTTGTQTCEEQPAPGSGTGVWGTCTGRTPTMEICDGRDNDCNGVADEGVTQRCGSGVGECRGLQQCTNGMFSGPCIGAMPPQPETCDGLDNNCNNMIDEGLDDLGSCGVPGVGICRQGRIRCVMGRQTCEGGTNPRTETCNGMDDDCNGVVDDNIGGGRRCTPPGTTIPMDMAGNPVGACRQGTVVCRSGAEVCEGAVGPTTEVCNGRDDDCDGMVDEGLDGMPCGSSVGECRMGVQRCMAGRLLCEGGRGPRPEECNCRDDDCNGRVDDMAAGGSPLCGGGAVCAGAPSCSCLRPCTDGEFPCPLGRVCQTIEGRRLCVGDLCVGRTCMGTQLCNPNTGMCEERCAGMAACDAPLVRDPMTCQCVRDDCTRPSRECPQGQLCQMGACVDDVCASMSCPPGQACYRGTCGAACAIIRCNAGERCTQGRCEPGEDLCASTPCTGDQYCDPMDGQCKRTQCTPATRCTRGQACDPATGVCVDDPCAGVVCPENSFCRRGECVRPAAPVVPRDRVYAGSGCSVGPSLPTQESPWRRAVPWGALLALAVVLRGRRAGREVQR